MEVKLKEETELWEPRGPCGSWGPAEEPRGPCGSWGPAEEPRGPAEEHTHSEAWKLPNVKEDPELCIKEEPEEFPFHIVTVKTDNEDDEDKSSVLHQSEENREETNGWDCGAEAGCSSDPLTQFHSDSEEHTDSSEDTDHSEDYSQQQAPVKRSYGSVDTPFTCPECGKGFRWKSHFQDHIFSHSGEKPHKCPVCEISFTQKGNLKRHLKTKHLMCPVRKARFSDEANLKKHLKTHEGAVDPLIVKSNGCLFVHSGEAPHKCSVCEKVYSTKSDLTRHQKCVHHICPVCQGVFPDGFKLKEHLRTHVEEGTVDPSILKSHICSECGKEFRSNADLQEHKFSHSGEKPHECPECGKRFTRRSYVKRHMLDHTGERPHKCSVCVKSFKDKQCLIKHEKNFHNVCRVCEAGFKYEAARELHMKTHRASSDSDSKPYKCLECGRRFPSVSRLQTHIRVHSEKRELHLESHVE